MHCLKQILPEKYFPFKNNAIFSYTKCRLMILADQKRKRRGIPSPGLGP